MTLTFRWCKKKRIEDLENLVAAYIMDSILTGDPEGLASALAKMESYLGGWFGWIFFRVTEILILPPRGRIRARRKG
ncbi:MAG: hypothetical protein JRF57_10565 [Deltaproteobacteria bacterium]|nr:hypothetical protein [Deltaproteobacteria bacterium]